MFTIDYGFAAIYDKSIPATLWQYYYGPINTVQIFRYGPDHENPYLVAIWRIKPKEIQPIINPVSVDHTAFGIN